MSLKRNNTIAKTRNSDEKEMGHQDHNQIMVKNVQIKITGYGDDDYISLTDIAKLKNKEFPAEVIKNWLRLRGTIDFLGLWEQINNGNFNMVEFDQFKKESGHNYFVMTPTKWQTSTNAIGLKTKSGKYGGGTYAHHDIALEFASWISAEVKLYIIKEFRRLKGEESQQLEWNDKRLFSKLNYMIQTDAIKKHLIPVELTNDQKSIIYASEADLLNVALFGLTSSEWKNQNENKEGNIRDYASTIELSILSNLEFYNSKLIKNKIPQNDRLLFLNKEANYEKELFNKNREKEIKVLDEHKNN